MSGAEAEVASSILRAEALLVPKGRELHRPRGAREDGQRRVQAEVREAVQVARVRNGVSGASLPGCWKKNSDSSRVHIFASHPLSHRGHHLC